MKLVVKKDLLLKALQKIQGVVEKRTTMPILNSVLIEASDKLIIKATNLENSIIVIKESKIDEKGSFCVPAKKIFEIIKNLPDENISIKKEERNILIKSGKSIFKLFIYPTEDFPTIKKTSSDKKISINKKDFIKSVEKVEYAIYPDESRISLNGIFLHKENNKLRFVTSDGYRLSYNEINFSGKCEDVLMPKKAITEIKKICTGEESENINMSFSENYVNIETEDTTLIARLNESKFPNYKEVFPENPFKAFIDKKIFIDTLERISTVSEENTNGIILAITKNKLNLKSSNIDIGEAEDEIDIKYEGENITIGFNALYLIDAVKPVESETIEVSFKDSQTAIVISGDDSYKALVMPIRI